MRIRPLLFACLAAAMLCAPRAVKAQSPTFYLIMAGDVSHDAGIASGVQQDLNTVYNACNRIARTLQYRLVSKTMLRGRGLDAGHIQAAIRNVPEQVDVLLFYFSGHGKMGASESFPTLQVGPKDNEWLQTQAVIATIRERSPKLAIVLTDCCNNPARGHLAKSEGGMLPPLAPGERDCLQALFTQQGEILLNACHPNQEAFQNEQGGYFTKAYVDALEQAARGGSCGWEALFKVSADATYRRVLADHRSTQQPFAIHNLRP